MSKLADIAARIVLIPLAAVVLLIGIVQILAELIRPSWFKTTQDRQADIVQHPGLEQSLRSVGDTGIKPDARGVIHTDGSDRNEQQDFEQHD